MYHRHWMPNTKKLPFWQKVKLHNWAIWKGFVIKLTQVATSCPFNFLAFFSCFGPFCFWIFRPFLFPFLSFPIFFEFLGLFKIVGPFSIVFGLFILHFCIFPILRQGSDVSKTISSSQSYKHFTILIYDPRVVNCLLDWPQQSSFKHSGT